MVTGEVTSLITELVRALGLPHAGTHDLWPQDNGPAVQQMRGVAFYYCVYRSYLISFLQPVCIEHLYEQSPPFPPAPVSCFSLGCGSGEVRNAARSALHLQFPSQCYWPGLAMKPLWSSMMMQEKAWCCSLWSRFTQES